MENDDETTIAGWVTSISSKYKLDEEQLFAFNKNGYVELRGKVFQGKHHAISLEEIKAGLNGIGYDDEGNPLNLTLDRAKKDKAEEYKIHIMPKNVIEFKLLTECLVTKLLQDRAFQQKLYRIKMLASLDEQEDGLLIARRSSKDVAYPFIAIYPALGKKNAQYVLDRVYDLCSGCKGLGVAPRYNIPVPFENEDQSLLFYAQGDGGEKEKEGNKEYYVEDRTLYSSMLEGIIKDYTLMNPNRYKSRPKTGLFKSVYTVLTGFGS